LVEQPIRNRQVSGSSPLVGSILSNYLAIRFTDTFVNARCAPDFSAQAASLRTFDRKKGRMKTKAVSGIECQGCPFTFTGGIKWLS
jgi:hypothetical protein